MGNGFGSVFRKVIAFVLVLTMLLSCTTVSFAEDRVASITDYSGKVKIVKSGGEIEFDAFKGMTIEQGDTIITGGNSWLSIEVDADKEVKIGENSYIGLTELIGSIKEENDKTSFFTWAGKIWTSIKRKLNVDSKYEIKTPTTIMGVKGTQFLVSRYGDTVTVVVLEGKVAAASYQIAGDGSTVVGSINEVIINPNQQLSVDGKIQDPSKAEIKEVTARDLDLFILEIIKENPAGIKQELLKEIDQIIREKKEAQQKQREKNSVNKESTKPIIVFDSSVGKTDPAPSTKDTTTLEPTTSDSDSGFSGGGSTPPLGTISFSDVSISQLHFEVQKSATIAATTVPADTQITIVSQNPDIVAVEPNGVLRGIAPGKAVIRVTAGKSGYTTAVKDVEVYVSQVTALPAILSEVAYIDNEFEVEILGSGDFHNYINKTYVTLGGDFTGLSIAEVKRDPVNTYKGIVRVNGVLKYSSGTGTITVAGNGWSGGHSLTATVRVAKIPANRYKALSLGGNHTIAIGTTDRVWGWGDNNTGQLGTGSWGVGRSTPIEAIKVKNATEVSAGENHSLALLSDGSVMSWGENTYGQLGDATPGFRKDPAIISIDTVAPIKHIASGRNHSLAVDSQNKVWGWGDNTLGQIGNGMGSAKITTAQAVYDFNTIGVSIKAIAAGYTHSVALDTEGNVWTWGDNQFGQLGNGDTGLLYSTQPVKVNSLSGMIAVSAGEQHTVALGSDKSIWVWGRNSHGQLGKPYDYNIYASPLKIPVLASDGSTVLFEKIDAGDNHTLALDSKGSVWSWGNNDVDQLGNGQVNKIVHIPQKIPQLSDIVSVSAGKAYSAALTVSGAVYSWGINYYGKLGDGTEIQRNTPVALAAASRMTAVSISLPNKMLLGTREGLEYAITSDIDGNNGTWIPCTSSAINSVQFKEGFLWVRQAEIPGEKYLLQHLWQSAAPSRIKLSDKEAANAYFMIDRGQGFVRAENSDGLEYSLDNGVTWAAINYLSYLPDDPDNTTVNSIGTKSIIVRYKGTTTKLASKATANLD